MAETTRIEWTDSTFNPWIGCTKISPACDHCYAAAMDKHFGGDHWGNVPRKRTGAATWHWPTRWQRKAGEFMAIHGRRRRVFCASMADVFDNQVPQQWRDDLWEVIRDCPDLDWQLLTKRPQNIAAMLPAFWDEIKGHVWLGTTVEDQQRANQNIPHLLQLDCAVRFVSIEPMLGPVDLRQWIDDWGCGCGYGGGATLDHCPECGWVGEGPGDDVPGDCPECRKPLSDYYACPECEGTNQDGSGFGPNTTVLDWVIAGGESGPKARPSHPDWFRSLRDQCKAADVAFFFKQWGEWAPGDAFGLCSDGPITDRHGNVRDWMRRYVVCEDRADRLTAHSFTDHATNLVYRVGKSRAGRLLDGVEHNAMPGFA